MSSPTFKLNLLCGSGAKASLLSASLLCLQSSGMAKAACSPQGLPSPQCSPCLQAAVSAREVWAVCLLTAFSSSLPLTWCFLEGKVSSANWGNWERASLAAVGVKLPWSLCNGKISGILLFGCMLVMSCSTEALITQPRAEPCSTEVHWMFWIVFLSLGFCSPGCACGSGWWVLCGRSFCVVLVGRFASGPVCYQVLTGWREHMEPGCAEATMENKTAPPTPPPPTPKSVSREK